MAAPTDSGVNRYFTTLLAHQGSVLSNLFDRAPHGREGLLVREQIVHDYLRTVFSPFVGIIQTPRYIREAAHQSTREITKAARSVKQQTLPFGLLGAHYRSPWTARGRRSAFAVHQGSIGTRLHALTIQGRLIVPTGARFPQVLADLWEAVFLEEYFNIFDRKLTLGEWARHQASEAPILILPEATVKSNSFNAFKRRPHLKKLLIVPGSILDAIATDSLVAQFTECISRGVEQALSSEATVWRELARRHDEYPDESFINYWGRLLQIASSLARDAIQGLDLGKELSRRHAYVLGEMLYQRKGQDIERSWLDMVHRGQSSKKPGMNDRVSDEEEIAAILHVVQSLQFYTRHHGENCIVFPYQRSKVQTRDLGTSRSGHQGGVARETSPTEPAHTCNLTLFWKGGRHFGVLAAQMEHVSRVFSQLVSIADTYSNPIEHVVTKGAGSESASSPLLSLCSELSEKSDSALSSEAVGASLQLARSVSRVIHEGEPRAFSFILGSPELLISDLSVVHDLTIDRPSFLFGGTFGDPHLDQRTLARLRGNSAFFQHSELALFLPYPRHPLEITHVVQVPGSGESRRDLLSAFTKRREGSVAIVTYGHGRGEVIQGGEVSALLIEDGTWVPSESYRKLLTFLKTWVTNFFPDAIAEELLGRLDPALRRTSEERGVGALFVVAKGRRAATLLARSTPLTSVLETIDGRSLHELDARALYDLARDDGATIIELPSLRVWGRRLLPADPVRRRRAEAGRPPALQPLEDLRMLEWGTRRRIALRVSEGLKNQGLAVVVSADGPILVMENGRVRAEFGGQTSAASPEQLVVSRANRSRKPQMSRPHL